MGTIVVADERSNFDVSWYKHASFVLRHYYDADRVAAYPHVLWVPNGFKDPDPGSEECAESCRSGPTWEARTWPCFAMLPVASTRRYLLTFSGSVHNSNRMAMMSEVKRLETTIEHNWEFFVQDAGRFGLTGAYGVCQSEMRDVLKNSIFCLAPCGNNPESHKLWEALWYGCIPILEEWLETDVNAAVVARAGRVTTWLVSLRAGILCTTC